MCKKLKNLKKNRKKFDKIFKKFWKFSKSENQKILKLIFGQKKLFYRTPETKIHRSEQFFDSQLKIKIFDFLDIGFLSEI